MPVKAGTILGRYRLLSPAGSGGMSEVWKAEDTTLGRTVAVKVILEPIAKDTTYRDRFLREARLVAGLDHPHVLPVFDFGTADVDGSKVPYLVMPLVTGGSLKERITGPLPFATAVNWLFAIAQALDHAHQKGILHRDIKPGNVLIDGTGRALLSDFGLARTAENTSGLTQTGTVLGTPLYMAPEQATGRPLDARADQYALGVIAFELLSGHVPFRADSPLAILHQHVAVAPPSISSVRPEVSNEAANILARALAKEPAQRFPTCTEFVTALATALGVSLSGPTAPYPAAAPATTVPSRSGFAAAASGPRGDSSQLATVISGAKSAAPTTPVLAAPASVATPRRTGLLTGVAALAVVLLGGGILYFRAATQARTPTATPAPATPPPATPPPATPPLPTPPLPPPVEPNPAPSIVPSPGLPPPSPAPSFPIRPSPPPVPPSLGPTVIPPTIPARIAEDRHDSGARRERGEERRESLFGHAGSAGDPALSSAWAALDTRHKPAGRLERSDLVTAMGESREVLSRRQTSEARFLDDYSRAGVSFADGDTSTAWQLLSRALSEAPSEAESRTIRYVSSLVRSYGRNPGPDAGWILGLAFADVRGDFNEELEKASMKAPNNARLLYARALRASELGRPKDALRYARMACDEGLREACQSR